jgi:hypothetical protein
MSGGVQVDVGGVLREVGRWDDRAALLPSPYGEVNDFGDAGCSQPVESPLAGWTSGQVILARHGSHGPTCQSLPGSPWRLNGIWTVPASTTGSSRAIYVGSAGQCTEAGFDTFYALTNASGSVDTLMPAPTLADPALAAAP